MIIVLTAARMLPLLTRRPSSIIITIAGMFSEQVPAGMKRNVMRDVLHPYASVNQTGPAAHSSVTTRFQYTVPMCSATIPAASSPVVLNVMTGMLRIVMTGSLEMIADRTEPTEDLNGIMIPVRTEIIFREKEPGTTLLIEEARIQGSQGNLKGITITVEMATCLAGKEQETMPVKDLTATSINNPGNLNAGPR